MTIARVLAVGLLCCAGVRPAQVSIDTITRGDSSRIEAPLTVVARTPAEWAALWKQHAGGDDPTPEVDLSRSMVVGVFLGSRPTAGYAVEITRIEKRSTELVVVYREQRPAFDAMVAQVLTAPFHVVRTGAYAGAVRFERAPR